MEMEMKLRNASRMLATLAALTMIGGAGLGAGAQMQQPYPPAPGNPVPTEPAIPFPSAAPAGTAGAPAARGRQTELPRDDADFVLMTEAIGTAMLDEAKYMVNRTPNPTLRGYAQRMIDDHSTVQVKLQAAMRASTVPAPSPSAVSALGTRGVDRLAELSGKQRDNAYVRMQTVALRRASDLMDWEAKNGKVASLKAFAVEMQPTIAQHQRMALAYESSGGTSMAADTGGGSPSGTAATAPVTNAVGGFTGSAIPPPPAAVPPPALAAPPPTPAPAPT